MFINAPFLHTASSGDEDYCHNLGLGQPVDAASFVLTPCNIGTQGVMHGNDKLSGARSREGLTEAVLLIQRVSPP